MCICMRAFAFSGSSLCALIVAVATCTVTTCMTLIGSTDSLSYGLRPIVSIYLRSSGYTMTQEVAEDGKMKIKLSDGTN